MATNLQKRTLAAKARRANRVRAKISGTAERPRLAVFRSNAHMYAQLIDDAAHKTILSVSDKEIGAKGTPVEIAKAVGAAIAKKAAAKNITQVVFDRRGYQYHGRVRNLAEGARSEGLKF